MTDKLMIPVIDNSDDVSTVGIFAQSPSVFPDLPTYDGKIQDFFNAVDGLSIGSLRSAYVLNRTEKITGTNSPPVNKYARRENRFVCKYTDTVTLKQYSFSIPCADLDLTTGDTVDLASTEGAALKSAFEAIATSELGNPVTLDAIEFRGATY